MEPGSGWAWALVLVLVPARFAVQVIRDAAAAGARSATIVTSGFSELQDDESQRLAVELDQAIEETLAAADGAFKAIS